MNTSFSTLPPDEESTRCALINRDKQPCSRSFERTCTRRWSLLDSRWTKMLCSITCESLIVKHEILRFSTHFQVMITCSWVLRMWHHHPRFQPNPVYRRLMKQALEQFANANVRSESHEQLDIPRHCLCVRKWRGYIQLRNDFPSGASNDIDKRLKSSGTTMWDISHSINYKLITEK